MVTKFDLNTHKYFRFLSRITINVNWCRNLKHYVLCTLNCVAKICYTYVFRFFIYPSGKIWAHVNISLPKFVFSGYLKITIFETVRKLKYWHVLGLISDFIIHKVLFFRDWVLMIFTLSLRILLCFIKWTGFIIHWKCLTYAELITHHVEC